MAAQEEFKLALQVGDRVRHDRELHDLTAVLRSQPGVVKGRRVSELCEIELLRLLDALQQSPRRVFNRLDARTADGEDLGRARVQILRVGRPEVAAIFFEHGMKVGAAKPEGADAATARRAVAGAEPGANFGVDVERRFGEVDA